MITKDLRLQTGVRIGIPSLLAVIIIALIGWDFMWDSEESLNRWAAALTILSVGTAPPGYFWKKRQDNIDKRTQASKNLYMELTDTWESLDRKRYEGDAGSFQPTDGSKEIFFMSRKFNHDFYDSLIFSGYINFLRPELQQQVQNIFRQIKTHNKYLDLVGTLQDEDESNKIPQKTYKYYRWMDTNEVKLEKDIPIILEKLKKTFTYN